MTLYEMGAEGKKGQFGHKFLWRSMDGQWTS